MSQSSVQIIQDQSLFQPASFKAAFPFITPATLGLLKLYELDMKQDHIYLVDVGFNEIFVYDRVSARSRTKLFLKLNLNNAPGLEAVEVPKHINVGVQLMGMPSFDSEFGEQGGWVTMDYSVLVGLEVDRHTVSILRHASNPLTTVKNSALRAGRQILPFQSYQEALLATAANQIEVAIANDPKVQATGLRVVTVDVEGISGSKQLAETIQQSFGRLLQAKDRRAIALEFASMDKEQFQMMLEAESPQAALEFRSRAANQMMEALLASGLNPAQLYMTTGQVAKDVGQPDSLAYVVASQSFKRIGAGDWPTLQIPAKVSHDTRLKWERQVMAERVPAQLQDDDGDTFSFALETGDMLKIIWDAATFPPQIYINGQNRSADFTSLSPGIYQYDKTTIWDLYVETRRLMGA